MHPLPTHSLQTSTFPQAGLGVFCFLFCFLVFSYDHQKPTRFFFKVWQDQLLYFHAVINVLFIWYLPSQLLSLACEHLIPLPTKDSIAVGTEVCLIFYLGGSDASISTETNPWLRVGRNRLTGHQESPRADKRATTARREFQTLDTDTRVRSCSKRLGFVHRGHQQQ